MATVSDSSSSTWTDPYKEFELYLEKAHEEIGAVFHQLEVTASRAAKQTSLVNNVVVAAPPVPVRRAAAVHHHAPLPANKAGIHYSQRRRAGLRVSEDYYVGDLATDGLSRQSRLNNHWNRKLHQQQHQQQQHPALAKSRSRWDAAELQRRISCPGFRHIDERCRADDGDDEWLEQERGNIETVGLMPTATLTDAVGDVDVHRKKKKQQPNPRRSLRRYLTADSALQLTDNGRIARHEPQQQPFRHHQSPYHPQAIQLWTTSLMAEFNHIIEGQLQQLANNDQCSGKAKRAASSASLMETGPAVELSPWARVQLALIDPSLAVSVNGVTSPGPSSATGPAKASSSSIQQLSADIDLVERQIFDDLDDMTLTLNNSQSPELLASCSTCSGEADHDHDNEDEAGGHASCPSAPTADETPVHMSSPLLRPQELQDFLRRVEDSIRTSNTTLDRGRFRRKDEHDDGQTTSPAFPLPPPPPLASLAAAGGVCQLDNDVNAAVAFQCHHPHQLEAINANRTGTPPPTTTFDNAGTQTSPMSLSRSSSFLWVSDCNCSGSLEDNGSVTGLNGHPLTSSSSAPASGQAHSEAGSSSISRIVHMDTSLSSLVSESSAAGRSACHRRNRILRTPDSGAAHEDDDEDDDEGSSVSLSHSIDGGVGVGGGGGAESGIGTGSPPPRDRRRRPVAVGDRPDVSVQTMPMNQAESDESSDLAVGDDEVSPLDSSASSLTDSSTSDEEREAAEPLAAAASASAAAAKKRDKVRRRETWEKIRRRHSCKRVHSRTSRNSKDKAEVVWIRRGQSETPPPPAVPAHLVAMPVGSAPVLTTLTDANLTSLLEPPKVLHKPPVVVVQSVTPRPRPRPLLFKLPGSEASTSTTTTGSCASAESTPTAVRLALQSVLAMELSPASECGGGHNNNNKSSSSSSSSSAAFLVPSAVGGATKKRHLKPISASSTPTEPYITMETGLAAARSHSESAFAELEATEACRWLRATGFPQYAQMYEDWQFPLDLNVVERDHPFLDVDSLQALFRRLAVLNRMAKLRNEKARIRPQGGDESEDEDQECALSDQWTFQRHSRRWSRIVDLPDDPTGLQALIAAGSAAANASTLSSGGGQPTTIEEDDPDGGMRPANSGMTLMDESCNTTDRTLNCDPVILGSFRRSSSERLKHGAKSLLRRMESLRSRSRRRPALVRPADGNLVISGPQLVDASGMEDRMKDLNCVDLSPPDSSASPTSSTPSPDLNRTVVKTQQFNSQDTSSSSIVSMTASAASTPTAEVAATPSPAGSMKIKRGFFQRRSFRPSASLSKSSGSAAQSAAAAAADSEQKDAHSDSECSPSYWRRSPSSSKDANSNETSTTTTAWNSLEQSLRWKSKKSRDPIPADMWRASTVPPLSDTMPTQMSQQRGKLYLNFTKPSVPVGKNAGCLMPSPDEEPLDLVSTPIVLRSLPAETPTPCGSLRDAERMVESFGFQNDSASTGTGTSGSHIDSDYSPAAPGRNPVVVRWHSFRRSSSSTSSVTLNSQPIAIGSLPVGQFALLRKLALLRLTALLERHTSSSKPSWGWDLPKFMRKTKSPDYKDKSMFGVPLSVTVQRTAEALPKPILSALHYLRQSALDQVGLFRKSGVRSRIAKLKELCEAWAWQCSGPSGCYGEDQPVDFSEHQPYDVADMVKQYFRELPEALMTNKLSETFVTIFQVVPVTHRLDALRCALLLLPDEHREALQTFLAFLTDVAALASINQMTPSNLAVCLAPSLFHLPATSASSSSSSSSSHNRSGGVGSGTSSTTSNGGTGGGAQSGNGNNINSSSAPSPRRRKTVGVPDQRELSQNKAAHECLLQMINDFRHLFTVPDDIFRQCRCNYLEDSVPVTLDDLRTVEFGDWQAYMNGCMAALLKEAKEKSRGWESSSNDVRVDVAWKKVGDGHALRLWRVSTEIEAPPGELLNRVLRERHLWDTSMVKWRCVVRLDKKSDVFHYTTSSEVPPVSRDVTLLRSWRTDLPRGACLVAEMSIDHSDTPVTPGTVRSIVLASRYLIQPCGAGKCRLVHLSRVDIMGRSPDWYNKHYGHVTALHMARIRDSFSQHLVADGPESKV
ncbi:hypothetical protein GHT06_017527 [Daphnia sinensis]|uniref:Rho GTPase-activating protein 7 n=1 Tax=Daphnia sinensis TaxID=1820382 RepID=A0AAD5PTX3_9CRUS|nr:hypothetical protein GHT06_017527 [Daphnia sinensis]